MNHPLCPYVCRRPYGWSPRRRDTKIRASDILARNFSMATKKIQMAAMDSPVSNYVFDFWLKWYLIEETSVAKKKYADYQGGTLLLKIETLSSTDF